MRMDLTTPTALAGLLDYQEKGIVSRVLLKGKGGTVTLFGFDAGSELSEHRTPFHALVQVVEGQAEIRIAADTHRVRAGQLLFLPADVPHAVRAPERFKMVLTMIRDDR
jgi:quercetin dioxygenase-like cupin family protein